MKQISSIYEPLSNAALGICSYDQNQKQSLHRCIVSSLVTWYQIHHGAISHTLQAYCSLPHHRGKALLHFFMQCSWLLFTVFSVTLVHVILNKQHILDHSGCLRYSDNSFCGRAIIIRRWMFKKNADFRPSGATSPCVLECGKLQKLVTGLYQIPKCFINPLLTRGCVEVIV